MIAKVFEAKTTLINKLSSGKSETFEELYFLDDAYISSKINKLKITHNMILEELSIADNDRQTFLIKRKKEVETEISILASNDLINLEFCLSIIDKNNSFNECLLALKSYVNNDKDDSFKRFTNYFNNRKYLLEHYLISKIYGELLYEKGSYIKSSQFLRKAVEKRPEDLNAHVLLMKCYEELDDDIMKIQEQEIIKILESR